MMDPLRAAFRQALLDCDVDRARDLAQRIAPERPIPETRDEALIVIHMARAQMTDIPAEARRFSITWLEAERRRVVAPIVGIGVMVDRDAPAWRHRLAEDLEGSMIEAVLQAVGDGVDLDRDDGEVKRRIDGARLRTEGRVHSLGGV